MEGSKLPQAQGFPQEDHTWQSVVCTNLYVCPMLLNVEYRDSDGWEHIEKLVERKPKG